jgi:hypothetical protein
MNGKIGQKLTTIIRPFGGPVKHNFEENDSLCTLGGRIANVSYFELDLKIDRVLYGTPDDQGAAKAGA